MINQEIKQSYQFLINTQPEWQFEKQSAYDFLIHHFKVYHLDGYGLQNMPAAICAAGALLRYIRDALSLPIHHIIDIGSFSTSQEVSLPLSTSHRPRRS